MNDSEFLITDHGGQGKKGDTVEKIFFVVV